MSTVRLQASGKGALQWLAFAHTDESFINNHTWTRRRLYPSEPDLRKALPLHKYEALGFKMAVPMPIIQIPWISDQDSAVPGPKFWGLPFSVGLIILNSTEGCSLLMQAHGPGATCTQQRGLDRREGQFLLSTSQDLESPTEGTLTEKLPRSAWSVAISLGKRLC